MSQAAWPTYEEVGAIMVSAGLASSAPSEAALAPYIAAAIDAWHRMTGFKPWLASASADYRYDPPAVQARGILDLRTGFTGVSAVAIGLTPDDSTGTVLTVDEDYVLRRYIERDSDTPYTEIHFLTGVGSRVNSIKVTGTKGYAATIADEVWLAVARKAALIAVEDVTESGGVVEEIKQGPVTIKYASGDAGGSVLVKWDKYFSDLAKRYRRAVY